MSAQTDSNCQPTVPNQEARDAGRTPLDLRGLRVHFVGIGGCGMSGLARLAKQLGAVCTGSDQQAGEAVNQLIAQGVDVTLTPSEKSVPKDCDLLVASAAIKPDHPERRAAQQRGVKIWKYAQLLGQLMVGQRGVAVAGTHGKSTTTSMLSHVLIEAGLDPSFIVGATCKQIGGGWRCGAKSDLLIAEACEFDRSFHHLHPTHAMILNVEADHLDIYRSLDEIIEAFRVFAHRLPKRGSLLINHEMGSRLAIAAGLDCAVETIGFAPQADWRVEVWGPHSGRREAASVVRAEVVLHRQGGEAVRWSAPLPGEHMAYNAAVTAVTAHRLGAKWEMIAKALAGFTGLDRRMQLIGLAADCPGVTVVDDYGHHPTEIDTTLRAFRNHYQPKRLICVFQPHQHSRTRFLMEQFAVSFSEADLVIVPDIYFVRDSEQERCTVQSDDLVNRVREQGRQAVHLSPFESILDHLRKVVQSGDLVVTMGAGDVWKIAHALVNGSGD